MRIWRPKLRLQHRLLLLRLLQPILGRLLRMLQGLLLPLVVLLLPLALSTPRFALLMSRKK